jgi:hypothetical protein
LDDSAGRRPRTCFGMDQNKGFVDGFELIFGMTYTNLDDYLLFAKRIIVMVLREHPMAKVQIPSTEKIEEYVQMVNQ